MSATIYPKDFYANRHHYTAHAATKVLGLVQPIVGIETIIDVGCATGTWLAAALELGAKTARGFEGDWLTPDMLNDSRIQLETANLEYPISTPGADLVMSLEVAEHLTPERAESFVSDLTKLSSAILFSAAIPGQGGVNHLNEQWQSYWAELFARQGYQPYDVIRPVIWGDDDIPAWYKQNIILYLNETAAAETELTPVVDLNRLDMVHPLFWERANRELKHADARPESEYLRDKDKSPSTR